MSATTNAPYTFQTPVPTKTPTRVATAHEPVLQTTTTIPVRTVVTTLLPSLPVLPARTFATAITVTPGSAAAPGDGNCPPGFLLL